MAIDHISFGTLDLQATRAFYEGQLEFPVLIDERMLVAEGGRVEHMFFDCGDNCALAFMQWVDVPGVPTDYDTDINRGLGVPPGTFHVAFRCASSEALTGRRRALQQRGVILGDELDLSPYRSFFFDDPVNGLRLEYTTRLSGTTAADQDPQQRQFPVDLSLFRDAARPRFAQA